MKRILVSLFPVLLLGLTVLCAPGAEPGAVPLRVLLTVGGHGFQEKEYAVLWDSLPGVKYTKITLPQQADLLKPGLEKDYDVIVRYDMCGGFAPEQEQAFAALIRGGMGLVATHHNIAAHAKWPEYWTMIGGHWFAQPGVIDGVTNGVSGYSHGEELKVTVADPEHPVVRGLEAFTIHDETYNNYYTSPSAKVLLKTDHAKNDPELMWVTQYGKGRVVYLMLGHDALAWKNPVYPDLLLRSMRWAAGR